jgi:antirestriction protein ArdC
MAIIRIKEYHERLIKGVKDVLDSMSFKEFLRFSAKFHNYSFGNALLIWGQYPKASRVAGMRTWNQIGRHVRKGEKGIAIFAPLVKKSKDRKADIDADSEPENEEERLVGFRAVYVWDIGQTEGDPIPVLEITSPVMDGSPVRLFNLIAGACPVPVAYEELGGNKKGYYVPKEKRIVLSKSLLPEEKCKTLLHEISHHLSIGKRLDEKSSDTSREVEEVIAEGAAFMASAHFGLDSSGYSFPYVASWAGKPEVVLSAGREMRDIAVSLINSIESNLNRSKEVEHEMSELSVSAVS